MQNLLLTILCLSLATINVAQNSDLIPWSESKLLVWEDFQGQPNPMSSNIAISATAFSFNLYSVGSTIHIETQSFFDTQESWTKEHVSSEILTHEQIHFDITELYARKLRKKLQETKFKSQGKKLGKELKSIYRLIYKELSEYQDKYDLETDHSRNKKVQLIWETKVAIELKKLSAYDNYEITIDMAKIK